MQASLSSPASFVEYTVRNKRESGELLAVCCNKLFGKTWDGELVLLQEVKASNPQLQVIRVIKTRGGNTSVAWLGEKEEILASAADDGGIYLWNTVNTKKEKPMRVLMEHDDVISSLAVNTMDLNSLLSASWDLSIKLWPVKSQVSSRSYYGHEALIHEVEWKRGSPNEFASVSNDGNIRIWDQRVDRSTSSFYVPVACPLYSLSWNHFNHNILATGGDDGVVIFDVRNLLQPLHHNRTIHKNRVRRVRFAPFNEQLLATASDDETAAVLNTSTATAQVVQKHADVVRGLSWSVAQQGTLAAASWDSSVSVVRVPSLSKAT